jgi:hypothetical protein
MTSEDAGTLMNPVDRRAARQLSEEANGGLAGLPTVERNPDGSWNYWAVKDTDNWIADYGRGNVLAMETCIYVADHSEQAHIIWKILNALPPQSATASGFRSCLEHLFIAFGGSFSDQPGMSPILSPRSSSCC